MAKKNNNIPLLLLVLLLLGTTVGTSYMWYTERESRQDCKETVTSNEEDIDALLFELTSLDVAYDSVEYLATALGIDNKAMGGSIDSLKTELMAAIQKGQIDEQTIKALQRKVNNLVAQNQTLTQEVTRVMAEKDSVELANISLQEQNLRITAEYATLETDYNNQQSEMENLNTEYNNLETKFTEVNRMKAQVLTLSFLNKRRKSTKKPKFVDFFNVSFTTGENDFRRGETLDYYIVILEKNSNRVIQSVSSGTTIMNGGNTVNYTAKISLRYDGSNKPITIDIPIDSEVDGTYEVRVYVDNTMVARSLASI